MRYFPMRRSTKLRLIVTCKCVHVVQVIRVRTYRETINGRQFGPKTSVSRRSRDVFFGALRFCSKFSREASPALSRANSLEQWEMSRMRGIRQETQEIVLSLVRCLSASWMPSVFRDYIDVPSSFALTKCKVDSSDDAIGDAQYADSFLVSSSLVDNC